MIIIKKSQFLIYQLATPPFPAEAFALPCMHQMPPDLLFYPIADIVKTSA
jgi:hypothetical protein